MTTTFTQAQINDIIEQAKIAAAVAATAVYEQDGDCDACGFAWVTFHGIKGNTKLGKMLKAAGLRQDHNRNFQMWNPSGLGVQSVSILGAGACAAARVFSDYGITAYAGSRLD